MLNKFKGVVSKLVGAARTGQYKTPRQGSWYSSPRDLPSFSFDTIRYMQWEPTVRLGLAMRVAPLMAAELAYKKGDKYVDGIEADKPWVADFVEKQTKRFWQTGLQDLLKAQVWGWAGGEVCYRLSRDKRFVEFDKILSRHASTIRAMKTDGSLSGVRFRIGETTQKTVDLSFPKAVWHSFRSEDGSNYGESILVGAYSPWSDKWLNGGALDVRRLFMTKDAYGGATMYFPTGTTQQTNSSGDSMSIENGDIAQMAVEQSKSGAVKTLPSKRDEAGNRLWEWEDAKVSSNPEHILKYPKDCDIEILRGMEIPDDVLVSEATGSWAGKVVPQRAFYSGLETWLSEIVSVWVTQILEPLVLLNFGRAEEFQVQTKPLSVEASEKEVSNDPVAHRQGVARDAGSNSGGGGFQFGLDKRETIELTAGEVVGSAEKIVEAARLSLDVKDDHKKRRNGRPKGDRGDIPGDIPIRKPTHRAIRMSDVKPKRMSGIPFDERKVRRESGRFADQPEDIIEGTPPTENATMVVIQAEETRATTELEKWAKDRKDNPNPNANRDSNMLVDMRRGVGVRMTNLRASIKEYEFNKGVDTSGMEGRLAEDAERMEQLNREVMSRKKYYELQRILLAASDAKTHGKLFLVEGEVVRLLGTAGDVYRDAKLDYKEYRPDLFTKSDLSGRMIRHYVDLPDGRRAHPDEIHDARKRGRLVVIDKVRVPGYDWVNDKPGEGSVEISDMENTALIAAAEEEAGRKPFGFSTDWQRFKGPRGGRGWRRGNEIVYQDEKPGSGGTATKAKPASKKSGGDHPDPEREPATERIRREKGIPKPEPKPEAKPEAKPEPTSVTDTPEFKAWFGGSKAVNADGTPLRVFHGTYATFDEFDNPFAENVDGDFHMLSTSPEYANQFAHGRGARIIPAYVKAENPLDLRSLPGRRGDVRNKLIKLLGKNGFDVERLEKAIPFRKDLFQLINSKEGTREIVTQAKERGIDSIVMPDAKSHVVDNKLEFIEAVTWIMFDANSIKSASGNNGDFSEDPRINFATEVRTKKKPVAKKKTKKKAKAKKPGGKK
tara:strand:- start:4428 stop:7601 length:3174 start_codon:yes stop_codon:yes gene_type:complete